MAISQERIRAHNASQCHYYETTDKKTMYPSGSPYVLRQIERVVRVADLQPEHALLEVGCGMGRYTLPLLDAGYRVTGMDLSDVLLNRLRSLAGARPLSLFACDVADVDRHAETRFDRAIGFFTLHHMHDLDLVYRGIGRVLRPGGMVAFCEPVGWNPLYYLQILITPGMTWAGDGGVAKMRSSLVHAAMARQGFTDLRTECFGFFPPVIANTAVGTWCERQLGRVRWPSAMQAFQIFAGRLPA